MSHRVAVQRVRNLEADLAESNKPKGSMQKRLVEAEQEVTNLKKTFQKVHICLEHCELRCVQYTCY